MKRTLNKLAKITLLGCIMILLHSCSDNIIKSEQIKNNSDQIIDLAGKWNVRLDSLNQGVEKEWFNSKLEGLEITLPGTLDEAKIGAEDTLTPALNNMVLSNLTRNHQYIGKAWYQKSIVIPKSWEDKDIEIGFERILWRSTLYIDSVKIGSKESLVGSHEYNLKNLLQPGEHTLTVLIDNSDLYPNINVIGNRYPLEVNQEMAHGYTNHTQIKWNGILGEMHLRVSDNKDIKNLQIHSDIKNNNLKVSFNAKDQITDEIEFRIENLSGQIQFKTKLDKIESDGDTMFFELPIPSELKTWDEFNPVLYKSTLKIRDQIIQTTFGHREIKNENAMLTLNGSRIFLRGNLECVIFPLTGRPPMLENEWIKLFEQAKNYGLNHIRFHSWCPPEAAFSAADKIGMYLQVELPHWSLKVGEDKRTTDFLKLEADKIIEDYGHHPSFLMMTMGNELEGDFSILNSMVSTLKEKDSRHLYATTSFSFQKPAGTRPEKEDEFFIAQWTEKGWIRGQGVFNDYSPSFEADFNSKSEHIKVPLISHEIGQYSVYPDISEIEKYTGVLSPLNFIAVKNDLEQKGLLNLASDFTQASGKLAAMLYKEEIERALKTPSFDGFQLLQLQDFPGQGTALVGLLNAFWESKGIISGESFREFNSALVPLVRFDKANYESGDILNVELEVANFYKELKSQTLSVKLTSHTGEVIQESQFENINLSIGNNINLGNFKVDIDVDRAQEWTLSVALEGTQFKNHWPVWVYPKRLSLDENSIIEVTRSFKEAIKLLNEGKSVFLNPDYEQLKGVTGRFVPVFWSPVHFPDQPATMGLLIDKEHKSLAQFPTQEFTQWQWWDLCKNSKSIILDDLDIEPVVRVIDNFVTNRSLGTLFEAKVGEGKLFFSSMDVSTNLDNRPAARQLKYSILKYMNSKAFAPNQKITPKELLNILQ